MGLLDDAKRYWVTEPQDVGYAAQDRAEEKYGNVGEWTKADAAKHMAWQAELAKRTMLPPMFAVPIANGIGLMKEVAVDGLGSAYQYATGNGGSPVNTWKNSIMDINNNFVGASRLGGSDNVIDDAVNLAGQSRGLLSESLRNRLPYAKK